MKRSLLISICLGVLTAGLVSAQPAPGQGPGRGRGPGRPGPGFGPGMNEHMNEQRLSRFLDLSAEQQNRIHTVFQEAQVIAKGLPERNADLNKQLSAAVKAGNDAEIERISQDLARVHQEQLALRAKTMAKVYATLTPEQKARFDRQVDGAFGVRGPRSPRRTQQ